LFISIRIAASCGQPLHVSDVPRGDRMMRVAVVMKDCETRKIDLKKRRERCQTENENYFT
jgi:hypothetical protein